MKNIPNDDLIIICPPLEVKVGKGGLEKAAKIFKRKVSADGILRDVRQHQAYMKPSVKRRKRWDDAARKRRKLHSRI